MTSRLMRILRGSAPVRSVNDNLAKVLQFGVSYAESIPLKQTCGTPSEALKEADDCERNWMRSFAETAQLSLSRIEDAIHADRFEIPHADNREGYCAGHDLLYWLTGYQDYLGISKLAADHGVSGGAFLDCGDVK